MLFHRPRFAAALAGLTFGLSHSAAAQGFDTPAVQMPQIPAITGFAPSVEAPSQARGQLTPVRLAAFLIEGGSEISRGMTWRVFQPDPDNEGKLPLVASSQGGAGAFELLPGSYLVHAAFGRAGATKRITVGNQSKREEIVLDAGGLKLDALLAGGKALQSGKLRFSVYEDKPDASGDRPLIVPDVEPNAVVRLNAGVYHVVSTYGSANAVVRSDIRVDAGKMTEATVEHKAAQITLKLVREEGGEALAETAWSVLTDAGDPVLETVGPYATLVLAEGSYTIVAKNHNRIYQRDITVESGNDTEVQMVANEASAIDPNEGAD